MRIWPTTVECTRDNPVATQEVSRGLKRFEEVSRGLKMSQELSRARFQEVWFQEVLRGFKRFPEETKLTKLHWWSNIHNNIQQRDHALVQKVRHYHSLQPRRAWICRPIPAKSETHVHLGISKGNVQKSPMLREPTHTCPLTTAITRHWPATKGGRWLV